MNATFIYANNEDSHQTVKVRSLIRVFIERMSEGHVVSHCGSLGLNVLFLLQICFCFVMREIS